MAIHLAPQIVKVTCLTRFLHSVVKVGESPAQEASKRGGVHLIKKLRQTEPSSEATRPNVPYSSHLCVSLPFLLQLPTWLWTQGKGPFHLPNYLVGSNEHMDTRRGSLSPSFLLSWLSSGGVYRPERGAGHGCRASPPGTSHPAGPVTLPN